MRTETESRGKDCSHPPVHRNSADYYSPVSAHKTDPLRVSQDLVDSIKRRYPIEGAVLDLMLLDGRAILVDAAGG